MKRRNRDIDVKYSKARLPLFEVQIFSLISLIGKKKKSFNSFEAPALGQTTCI
jgi:hypothetical protein